MNSLILPTMGLIVSLLLFYKGGFDIKWPKKVDMLLNKETKGKIGLVSFYNCILTFVIHLSTEQTCLCLTSVTWQEPLLLAWL